VRALEDRSILLRRLAGQLEGQGQPRSASRFRRRAHEAEGQAELMRSALAQAAETTLSVVRDDDEGTPSEERIA